MMDFVTHLPQTSGRHDAVWVIVDQLTKSAHFLAMRVIVDQLTKSVHILVVRMTFTLEEFCRSYIQEIFRLHGVPVSIVLDRDPRFTTHFLEGFHRAMETQLMMSTAFHPQTDGQLERTIQTLEDMLRACAWDFKGSWEEHFSLVEFTYNNSNHASIDGTL